MTRKYEKLRAGAQKALEESGWYYDADRGYWMHDLEKDKKWVSLRDANVQQRDDADKLRTSKREFVIAVMKLLGVYARFPYQVKESAEPSANLWAFEADVLKAAKDFESERALKRIRRAVRDGLLKDSA